MTLPLAPESPEGHWTLRTSEAAYAGGGSKVQRAAGAEEDSLEERGGDKTLRPKGELPRSSGFVFIHLFGKEPTERLLEEAEEEGLGGGRGRLVQMFSREIWTELMTF